VLMSKYTAEQFIIYVVHLFSYSRHIGVAVSSPFAATFAAPNIVRNHTATRSSRQSINKNNF